MKILPLALRCAVYSSQVLSLFLLLQRCAVPAFAQTSDFQRHSSFFALYKQDPKDLSFEATIERDRESDDGEVEYDLERYRVNTELLFPLAQEELFLRVGGGYELRQYDFVFSRGTEFGVRDQSLSTHAAYLRAGAGAFLSPTLLLNGFMDLGIASDFDEFGGTDALRLELQTELVFQMNPGTQLILGVRRGYEFEDVSVYPLLGLRVSDPSGRLRLLLDVPIRLQLAYRINELLDLYGLAYAWGKEYELREGAAGQQGSLHLFERRAALGIRVLPGSTLVLESELGFAFDDRFDFDFDRTLSLARDIDPGAYLSLRIGFTL